MRRISVINFLIAAAILVTGVLSVPCQERVESRSTLESLEITVERTDAPLRFIFQDLIEKYDVPIGFEEASDFIENRDLTFDTNKKLSSPCPLGTIPPNCIPDRPMVRKTFTINVKNVKLSVVLDSIAAQLGGYRWEVRDEVVNFVPTLNRSEIIQDFLELKITKFTIPRRTGEPTVMDLSFAVMGSPEVKDFSEKRGLKNFTTAESYQQNKLVRRPDGLEDLSGIQIVDLLNQITRQKRGGWVVRMQKSSLGDEGLILIL